MRNKRDRNINKAYQKIKSLQGFLNKQFPDEFWDGGDSEMPSLTAEESLANEAKLWNAAKQSSGCMYCREPKE